jgi:hypothetical protein
MPPSHRGSTVTSMTRQHYHQHDSTSISRCDQVVSAAPSPAWLTSTIASMTRLLHHAMAKSPQQHHRQHSSIVSSHNNLIVNINNIWLQRQADTLSAHTETICQYTWLQGQCKHLIVLLDTSMIHLHFEDSHLKTLDSWVKFFRRFNSRGEGYT